MLVVFAALTAVSGIVLVVGVIWWLAARAETVPRSGSNVGAEIMGIRRATTTR